MKNSLALIVALASGLALSAAAQTLPAPAPVFVAMPDDITCTAHDFTMSGTEGSGWGPSSIGGLSCKISGVVATQAKEVPLASGNFANGMLATLSFGDFKVKVTGGQSLQIEIRQDELQSFRQFLLGADAAAMPAGAAAAPAGSEKIGVINFQAAVFQTMEGKRALDEILKKYEPQKQQVKALQSEIDTLSKQLEAEGAKLSEAEHTLQAKAIDDKKTDLQREIEQSQKDFQKDLQGVFKPLASKLGEVLLAYAQQQGFALVVNGSQQQNPVVYASPAIKPIDITNAIVEAYDAHPGAAGSAASSANSAPRPSATATPTVQVTNYLVAAATLDSSATKPFLSARCQGDLVTEFQANDRSKWKFSANDTIIASEKIDANSGQATVVAQIVFKGGNPPTFMQQNQTFLLVKEDGAWKIVKIDPPPKTTSPGYEPL